MKHKFELRFSTFGNFFGSEVKVSFVSFVVPLQNFLDFATKREKKVFLSMKCCPSKFPANFGSSEAQTKMVVFTSAASASTSSVSSSMNVGDASPPLRSSMTVTDELRVDLSSGVAEICRTDIRTDGDIDSGPESFGDMEALRDDVTDATDATCDVMEGR